MTTWYVGAGKCTSTLTQEVYEGMADPKMWNACLEFDLPSAMVMSRMHGNPHYDVCDLGLQPSPGRMRRQMDYYEAAFASGDDPLLYKYLFENLAKVWSKGEAIHIISIDDPMLVEKGEAFIHKQFTDYLADEFLKPKDEQAVWVDTIRAYLALQFTQQQNHGNVTSPVVFEPIRQLFGLPYEWHGAPIED